MDEPSMSRTVAGMHVATVPTLADVLALSAALDSRADAVWAHLHSASSVISESEYAAATVERDEALAALRPVRGRVDELLEAGELPADAYLVSLEADLREAVSVADAAAEKFRRYGEVKAGTEHVAGRVAEGLHQLTNAAAVLPEHQRASWSRIAADGYESLQHAAAIANDRQWVAALDLLTSLEAQVEAALTDLRIGAPSPSTPAAPSTSAATEAAPAPVETVSPDSPRAEDVALSAAAAPIHRTAEESPAEELPAAGLDNTGATPGDTVVPSVDELENEAARLRAEGSEVVAEFTRLRPHVADAVATGWETQLRAAATAIMPGAAATSWARDPHLAADQLAESAQTLNGIRKALAQVAAYEDGS